jgi:hypothetical protein
VPFWHLFELCPQLPQAVEPLPLFAERTRTGLAVFTAGAFEEGAVVMLPCGLDKFYD